MRKLFTILVLTALFVAPSASAHPTSAPKSDEGCQAMNPLRSSCTFKVTHTSHSPVTGAAGWGSWLVTVKRGGETLEFEGAPDGRFWIVEISWKVGDKVTVEAVSPGSAVDAGHFD